MALLLFILSPLTRAGCAPSPVSVWGWSPSRERTRAERTSIIVSVYPISCKYLKVTIQQFHFCKLQNMYFNLAKNSQKFWQYHLFWKLRLKSAFLEWKETVIYQVNDWLLLKEFNSDTTPCFNGRYEGRVVVHLCRTTDLLKLHIITNFDKHTVV
jgi:hypothetical protein